MESIETNIHERKYETHVYEATIHEVCKVGISVHRHLPLHCHGICVVGQVSLCSCQVTWKLDCTTDPGLVQGARWIWVLNLLWILAVGFKYWLFVTLCPGWFVEMSMVHIYICAPLFILLLTSCAGDGTAIWQVICFSNHDMGIPEYL